MSGAMRKIGSGLFQTSPQALATGRAIGQIRQGHLEDSGVDEIRTLMHSTPNGHPFAINPRRVFDVDDEERQRIFEDGWAKGGLQFPADRPLPVGLVRTLVKLRLDEIADVRNGKRHVHFPDGSLKAVGPMRDGELHGSWRWYRADGSLLRTGRFDRGTKVGTWTTHHRPPT